MPIICFTPIFVNTDKNIANFIASEEKFGFFKFDRFIKILNIGDIVKVRFDGNGSDGLYRILSLEKSEDDNVRDQFIKSIKAELRIGEGKGFGFLQDVFVHPNFVRKYKLQDKQLIQGKAVTSFNASKKSWDGNYLKSIQFNRSCWPRTGRADSK